MKGYLPVHVCDRIVYLSKEMELSVRQIKRRLDFDGVTVSERGIRGVLERFRTTGTTAHRPRSGRSRKHDDGLDDFLDGLYTANQETSATDAARKIQSELGMYANSVIIWI